MGTARGMEADPKARLSFQQTSTLKMCGSTAQISLLQSATELDDTMLPGAAKGELVQAGSTCAQLVVFAESAAQTLAVREDRTQNCDEQISGSPLSLITQ